MGLCIQKFTVSSAVSTAPPLGPVAMAEQQASLQKKCQDLISNGKVVIFSKTTCPYCTRVKNLFENLGVKPVTVVELDVESDGVEIQSYLLQLTGQKTVPNVFIGGEHLGGCDDTMAAYGNGSLMKKLGELSTVGIENNPSGLTIDGKIDQLINNRVAIFSKSYCPFCTKVKNLFAELNEAAAVLELDLEPDGSEIHDRLKQRVQQNTVPVVFVRGQKVGGCDDTFNAHGSGLLQKLLYGNEIKQTNDYMYDLFVIGGGSGGLAAAKEAASLGLKVGLADFVVPTPIGTTWGLGGTCVNVGCIPKKLMHQAALLGDSIKEDVKSFGWNVEPVAHSWETMVENIQNYVKSLNFGYRKELMKRQVKYYNSYAELVDNHTVVLTNKKGGQEQVTTSKFLIAVGGRPVYPDIPGAKEFGITSDDIFSLKNSPGKTLIVGASYIALECGGFLRGLGFEVTILVRSILLRGFDKQMAELIGQDMERHGVEFKRGYVPVEVKRDSVTGKLTVLVQSNTGGSVETLNNFDTVLFAIGREACTAKIGLDKVQIRTDPKSKKIVVDEAEKTSLSHIYAIGDVLQGKPELTPVAIQAGRLLAGRLAGLHKRLTNYKHVPTTVFTPVEYGCVGMSEEEAYSVFGDNNIVIYHNAFKPLEHGLSRGATVGYAKLVCVKSLNDLVVGFHVLSPNAGEITQGFAIGLKLGATKSDFDDLIGIHPTCAEVFTTMVLTKKKGDAPPETTGC